MRYEANSFEPLRGYTLIEVLISLFIFSIVVVVFSTSLSQVIKNKSVIDETIAKYADLQYSMSLFDQDMSQVVQWPRNIQPNEIGAFFTDGQTLTLSKYGNIQRNYNYVNTAIEKIKYEFNPPVIIRHSYDENGNLRHKRVIFKDINRVTLKFYDENMKQYSIWPPLTPWKDKVPTAIEINITHNYFGNIVRLYQIGSLVQGVADE